MVCRLCANLQDNLIPLFEGEGQDNNLPDRISKYLDFSVHMKKGLPSSVCVQCTMSLLNWHSFYQNCEKINEHFRAMLTNKSTSTTLGVIQKMMQPNPVQISTDHGDKELNESDDDDVVGIDFDEDSSAFNKILKEAEATELTKTVSPEDIIMPEPLIEEEEVEEVVVIVEEDEIRDQKAAEEVVPLAESQEIQLVQETVESTTQRKSGRRKLPRYVAFTIVTLGIDLLLVKKISLRILLSIDYPEASLVRLPCGRDIIE